MNTQTAQEVQPDRRIGAGIAAGIVVGTLFGLSGFFLITFPEGRALGQVLFIVLPFAAGIAIALVVTDAVGRLAGAAILAAVPSVLLCLVSLVALHLEGVLCAVLAFPLIFVALLIGVGIGVLLVEVTKLIRGFPANSIILLALPTLVAVGHRLEMKSLLQTREQNVTTSIHLAASPQEVWRNIQALDRVAGRKPLLMHLGLPVPQKCVLQGTSVGSKRICYFDQGSIEETVLEWQPPYHMRLSIDRTNMPGRHWLEFDGAEYDLQADAGGTTLTRVTTIRSNLRPAWYWGRLERWGVSTEHDYLFSDLARRFPSSRP